MLQTHRRRKLIKLIAFMDICLAIFFISTDPNKLPIILLIAPIIWLFISLSLTFYTVLNWSSLPDKAITAKDGAFSMIASGVICTILLLRSVNQLNGRDILLTTIFLVVASVYVKKLKLQVA